MKRGGEKERWIEGGGQQMGTPLLLSADHSFSSKKDSQARKKGRDEQRWQEEPFGADILTPAIPHFLTHSSLRTFLRIHFIIVVEQNCVIP